MNKFLLLNLCRPTKVVKVGAKHTRGFCPPVSSPCVAADTAPQAPAVAPKKAKAGKRASKTEKPAQAREGSKTAQILELLKRPGGATLKGIMPATGWQAHSVRGFISGTLGKKMQLDVVSAKGEDGERTYSLKG